MSDWDHTAKFAVSLPITIDDVMKMMALGLTDVEINAMAKILDGVERPDNYCVEIVGFTRYDHTLTHEEILQHYQDWLLQKQIGEGDENTGTTF